METRRGALVRVVMLAALFLARSALDARPVQPSTPPERAAGAWSPPRTPDGQPDLQGVWVNFDGTPLEAPDAADTARLKALAEWFPGIDAPGDRREIRGPNPAPEFSDVAVKRSPRRRSLVVEPASGRVPILPDAEARRASNLAQLTDSWDRHTPWERCITRGVPGGMFPAGYNNGYLILQAPGYVAILYEMIHEPRIIPLDGRAHLDQRIRQWNGDSRGHWEGQTLVVEVTNYREEPVGAVATGIATTATLKGVPQTQAMRAVERFTRIDADTLQYEVTIEDPGVYRLPWKVAMPLNRANDYRLFEYACHEGNYGLPNSLSGARAQDLAAPGTRPK